MSRTSSVPVVHRPVVHPVTSPYLPLVASSAASAGDLAMPHPLPQLRLTVVGGGTARNPSAGGAYVGCVGGANARDVGH
jgi:hypothetical protein